MDADCTAGHRLPVPDRPRSNKHKKTMCWKTRGSRSRSTALRAWLLFSLLIAFGFRQHAEAEPNVILFVVDDMGWSDWSAGSNFYETPNMERLAARGVRFTDAYAACSVCSPTRASLMTGMSPAVHGITKWIPGNPDNRQTHADEPMSAWNLDGGHVTIAEALKAAGYHTGHIGKWHLGEPGHLSADPTNHGFDVNVGGSDLGQPPSYTDRSSYMNLPNLDPGISENFLTDHLAIEATNFISQHLAGPDGVSPFFLNYNLFAVHTPVQSHPDHIAYFQNKRDTVPDLTHDNAAYASMVKAMDEALGAVLDTLDAEGIEDDTLIIFTSDNGGLLTFTNNEPLRGGKGQGWEGGHRVPMIVAGPGIQEGIVSPFQVISHDLYPTILELTETPGDATHNAEVDGESFADVLTGIQGDTRDTPLFWHFPHPSNSGGGPYGVAIQGDLKFYQNYQTGQQLHFDLSADLDESEDLATADPATTLELRDLLHTYLESTETHLWEGFELFPPVDPTPSSRSGSIAVNLSGDTDDTRSLGEDEVAGIVPQSNWNNLEGATAAGGELMVIDAVDDSGAATTADISIVARPSGVRPSAGASPDHQIYNHGVFVTENNDPPDTLEVAMTASQVPYALYDVIIYMGRNHDSDVLDDRVYQFELDGVSIFGGETNDAVGFTGFVEASGSDFAAPDANYVRFNGITGDSITVRAASSAGRATISGVQIVSARSPRITAVSLESRVVTLTWESRPGATYTVRYSYDMADWSADLDDGITPDPGERTTRTFDLDAAGLPAAGRVFFRVETE